MNWQIEMFKALIEIVKQGGLYAIWGIVAWFGMGIIKIAVIGGIIWGIIRLVAYSVQTYLCLRLISRKEHIQILSNKCSKHIIASIKDYQNTTSQAMLDLVKDVKDLLEKSKNETKTTVSPKKEA